MGSAGSLGHHSRRIAVRHQPAAAAMGAGSRWEVAAGQDPSVAASCAAGTARTAAEPGRSPDRFERLLDVDARLLACVGSLPPSSSPSTPCGSP